MKQSFNIGQSFDGVHGKLPKLQFRTPNSASVIMPRAVCSVFAGVIVNLHWWVESLRKQPSWSL